MIKIIFKTNSVFYVLFKVTKWVDLKNFNHKKNLWEVMDVDWIHFVNQFTIYTYIKSKYYIPTTNPVLYVNYISMK